MSEDNDDGDDGKDGEGTEAETVDDRRHELPLAARLLVLAVLAHLERQQPQLG